MRKVFGVVTALLLLGGTPLLAQEAGAPDGGVGGDAADVERQGQVGTGPQIRAEDPARQQIQQEDAARTEVPSVQGRTTPTDAAPAGGGAAVTGQQTETGGAAPAETGGGMAETDEYQTGGAMPTTASNLPAVALVGAILLAAGAAIGLARRNGR